MAKQNLTREQVYAIKLKETWKLSIPRLLAELDVLELHQRIDEERFNIAEESISLRQLALYDPGIEHYLHCTTTAP